MTLCRCSVKNCPDLCASHRFPNPEVDLDRFRLWVQLTGNVELESLEPEKIYKNRRVCYRHFTKEDMGPNKRLYKTAVIKLYLPNNQFVANHATNTTNCPELQEHDYFLHTSSENNSVARIEATPKPQVCINNEHSYSTHTLFSNEEQEHDYVKPQSTTDKPLMGRSSLLNKSSQAPANASRLFRDPPQALLNCSSTTSSATYLNLTSNSPQGNVNVLVCVNTCNNDKPAPTSNIPANISSTAKTTSDSNLKQVCPPVDEGSKCKEPNTNSINQLNVSKGHSSCETSNNNSKKHKSVARHDIFCNTCDAKVIYPNEPKKVIEAAVVPIEETEVITALVLPTEEHEVIEAPILSTGETEMIEESFQASPNPKAKHKSESSLKEQKAAHLKSQQADLAKKNQITLHNRLAEGKRIVNTESFRKITKNLNTFAKTLFDNQIKNATKASRARRFTFKDKVLALALYKESGQEYGELCQAFSLPSRKTLRALLLHLPIDPGFNNNHLFKHLKAIAENLPQLDRYCTVTFGELTLKPYLEWNTVDDIVEGFEDNGTCRTDKVADHAQVFMVRGLLKQWEQPLLFAFSNGYRRKEDTVATLTEIIRQLQWAGFSVIATICNQDGENASAINLMIEQTHLQDDGKQVFEVNNEEIIPLYDPSWLLMDLRNSLLVKDLIYQDKGETKIACWKHISKAYKLDAASGELRLMSKLTNKHLNPDEIGKRILSYCLDVFSRTVAATLNFMSMAGTTPEAKDTATIVLFFSKLFESVTGFGASKNSDKDSQLPIVEFWNEAKEKLRNIQFWDSHENQFIVPLSIHGWIITLNSLKLLREKLLNLGHDPALAQLFNTNPITNFFEKVCQSFPKPTCRNVRTMFKSLLLNTIISKNCVAIESEQDSYRSLMTLKHIFNKGVAEQKHGDESWALPLYNMPTLEELSVLQLDDEKYVVELFTKKISSILPECRICQTNIFRETDDNNTIPNPPSTEADVQAVNLNPNFINGLSRIYFFRKHILPAVSHLKGFYKKLVEEVMQKEIFAFEECEHSEGMKKWAKSNFLKLVVETYFKDSNRVFKKSFTYGTSKKHVRARKRITASSTDVTSGKRVKTSKRKKSKTFSLQN